MQSFMYDQLNLLGNSLKRERKVYQLVSDYRTPTRTVSIGLVVVLLAGCATGEEIELLVHHTGGGSLGIRPQRVAVVIPSTTDPMLVNAYARLDADTGHLFHIGLGSHIVERSELAAVHEEQHRQYFEPAAEETTVRLGRLLGADVLILYRIKIPALRERLFAVEADQMSPVTIFGKATRVETGEEVWSHVVTVEIGRVRHQTVEVSFDHAIWHAVNRGVEEMLAALAEAVVGEQVRSETHRQDRQ